MWKRRELISAVLFSWALLFFATPADAAKVQYVFKAWNGPAIEVNLTRPAGLAPDRPVVFVMHGMGRNAREYRDQWHDLAIEHDFLLVVPGFSEKNFPGAEQYNLGNVFARDGSLQAEREWTYASIEPLFDDVRSRYGLSAESYSMYGHSAGAQFVHRFIFHVSATRVAQVVVANAGWYMMPDATTEFPYGLKGSVVGRERLEQALQVPVTVLLGDRDTDPDHSSLRKAPPAMAQGEHRLARGYAFFEAAREAAAQLGVPFNWRLETVAGADHDNRLMAPASIPFLLSTEP